VADANLFPDEAGFTPRPAWQVIEAARRQYLTGELKLSTNPATRIYLRDGQVYFAERASDGTLAIRLMMEGVITRDQMQRGTVIVNGVEHVGRMFEADPTIDRASVELCTELFTDDVMVSVANVTINRYEMALYRRHPSGIERWYPHSFPFAGRQSEPQREPAPAAKAAAKPKPKPEVQREMQPQQQQAPQTQARSEPKNNLTAPPITQAVPVTASAASNVPPPPPITQVMPVTQALPVTSPPTGQMPVTMPAPTAQVPVTPPPAAASAEIEATAIPDEVAEAQKRAIAVIGA
jgi:hypothetical protein